MCRTSYKEDFCDTPSALDLCNGLNYFVVPTNETTKRAGLQGQEGQPTRCAPASSSSTVAAAEAADSVNAIVPTNKTVLKQMKDVMERILEQETELTNHLRQQQAQLNQFQTRMNEHMQTHAISATVQRTKTEDKELKKKLDITFVNILKQKILNSIPNGRGNGSTPYTNL